MGCFSPVYNGLRDYRVDLRRGRKPAIYLSEGVRSQRRIDPRKKILGRVRLSLQMSFGGLYARFRFQLSPGADQTTNSTPIKLRFLRLRIKSAMSLAFPNES